MSTSRPGKAAMTFQAKLLLIVFPMVFLAILGMGLWNFSEERDSVYLHTFSHMELMLRETLETDLARRERLLRSIRMDHLDFFVTEYQREALASISERGSRQGGQYVVLDRHRNPVSSAGTDMPGFTGKFREKITSDLAKSRPGEVIRGFYSAGEIHHFYAAIHYPPWDWVLVHTQEAAGVRAAITRIFWRTSLGISVCVLGAILGILWLLKKFLIKQVLVLKDAAGRIAQKESVETIPLDSGDELGELARSMEIMSRQLRDHDLRQKALREELAAANQELSRLSRQMEQQVSEQTQDLADKNRELSQNIRSIQQELTSTEMDRNRLTQKISELLLKQSDIAQYNADVLKKLKLVHEENQVLREQVKSYAELVRPDWSSD